MPHPMLALRLRTPPQIEQHLTLATETGYQASDSPVQAHGRLTIKVLTELLRTKPAEIRALFRQMMEPDRLRQLKDQMLAAGLPA